MILEQTHSDMQIFMDELFLKKKQADKSLFLIVCRVCFFSIENTSGAAKPRSKYPKVKAQQF